MFSLFLTSIKYKNAYRDKIFSTQQNEENERPQMFFKKKFYCYTKIKKSYIIIITDNIKYFFHKLPEKELFSIIKYALSTNKT